MSENFITPTAQKRLLKDVKDILKNPLTSHGIYYIHDEQNIMKGYACIMGPDDTIYSSGAYLFTFDFPGEYPFKPPSLKYLTNNGKTRFHPNLYRNGKVCLSLLNTWKGEQWTSCQTIRSILITLLSLLHNKPLLNEPGIHESNKDFIPYNRIIEYMNINTAINEVLEKKVAYQAFSHIWDNIINHFKKETSNIIDYIETLSQKYKKKENLRVRIYDMNVEINYISLLEKTKKNLDLINK